MIDKERNLLKQLLPLNYKEVFYKEYYEARQSKESLDMFIEVLPDKLEKSGVTLINDSATKNLHFSEDNTFFKTDGNNIGVSLHNRYSLPLRHKHAFFEIMYVLNGIVQNVFDNTQLELHTGDVCIVSPESYHIVNVNNDETILINILIRASTFYETFSDILVFENVLADFFTRTLYINYANEYILFHTKGNKALETQLELLIKDGLCRDEYSDKLMKELLVSCFIYILRHHARTAKISESIDSHLMLTSKVISYMQKNYREVTLKSVSKHFNYSSQYISKLIKDSTNKTFSSILQEIRLTEACVLLKSTNQTLATISETVGYNNVEHFHRIFKKAKGYTPTTYRLNNSLEIY